MKVLVVEDAKAALNALEALLGGLPGMGEVRVAELVAEARRLCAGFAPDVAVLDILLPDGNGMELVPAIRAANPRARIVMLSHYPDIHREPALQAGAELFLDKAAGFDGLGRQLSTWLGEAA